MKLVKSTDLEIGSHVAMVIDAPNIRGFELWHQGTIEKLEACDMWGTPSETHTTLYIKLKGNWEYETATVHNSHNWLVREEK